MTHAQAAAAAAARQGRPIDIIRHSQRERELIREVTTTTAIYDPDDNRVSVASRSSPNPFRPLVSCLGPVAATFPLQQLCLYFCTENQFHDAHSPPLSLLQHDDEAPSSALAVLQKKGSSGKGGGQVYMD